MEVTIQIIKVYNTCPLGTHSLLGVKIVSADSCTADIYQWLSMVCSLAFLEHIWKYGWFGLPQLTGMCCWDEWAGASGAKYLYCVGQLGKRKWFSYLDANTLPAEDTFTQTENALGIWEMGRLKTKEIKKPSSKWNLKVLLMRGWILTGGHVVRRFF